MPEAPSPSGGGIRQQRAAELKAEAERKVRLEEEAARREQEQAATASAREDDVETLVDVQQPADDDRAEDQGAGPIGQGDYVVKQGDCMNSIAYRYGFFWETLWDLSENSELKRAREDPNVLLADDRVTIPELRRKEEPGATEEHHRFRRKGIPPKLRMQVCQLGEPRAGAKFRLVIDREEQDGMLDNEGRFEVYIRPDATYAKLYVGEEEDEDEYDLRLAHLDPVDTLRGAEQRLENMGFAVGNTDGAMDEQTRSALRNYQGSKEIEVTGKLDQATMDQLKQDHGS